MIRRLDTGERGARFLPQDEGASHHADFVCSACGAVRALEHVHLTVAMPDAPAVILRREFDLRIRGLCDDCA